MIYVGTQMGFVSTFTGYNALRPIDRTVQLGYDFMIKVIVRYSLRLKLCILVSALEFNRIVGIVCWVNNLQNILQI